MCSFVCLLVVWPNSLLVWYMLAGVSCVFLCLMWSCTLIFFYKTHPNKRLHDNHHYRVPTNVNTSSIVCCFLFSCAIFSGVIIALLHNYIFIQEVVLPTQYEAPLPTYVISVTFIMAIIMFTFLCLNCVCYFHFVRVHAGNACYSIDRFL